MASSLQVENWEIDRLIPYARNPRKNDDVVDKMVSAIKEFGFRIPIVAKSDGSVVDGHLRLKAAKKLGMTEVPVALADELTDEQVKAFRILANKSANWAEWDNDLLKLEIEELKLANFNLDLTGFSEIEINDFLKDEPIQKNEENIESTNTLSQEEQKKEPITKLGDIWLLDSHKLLCADCTKSENISFLIPVNIPDLLPSLLLTDPPYGIKQDKGVRDGGKRFSEIRKYEDSWDSEIPTKDVFDYLLGICTNAIIFGGNYFAHILPRSTHWLVWDKHQTMPTYSDCELAWTNIDRLSVKKFDVVQSGMVAKEKQRYHPTQKPVELFIQILNEYTAAGDTVLDTYLGSGTTLLACEQTGRVCYGMELSPHYCDVTIDRWQQLTGKDAVLASNGKTYNSLLQTE